MFKGRRLVIATKHKKEIVLGPLLEKNLEVKTFVPENFDTDLYGTFSGEIERKDEPVSTVRKKCLEAMEKNSCDLGIASEGSFGSHPHVPFMPGNEEVIIFIDKKNDLEIIGRELTLETNFSGEEITNWKNLKDFADRTKFPSHALILRSKEKDAEQIIKGVSDWKSLDSWYRKLSRNGNSVFVETDMRALYNPTRMKAIERAGQLLVEKIKSCCPHCHTPGFGVTEAKQGLLCSLCGSATRSIRSYIFECQKCSFKTEEEFPQKKLSEDPEFCDFCNP